MVEKAQYNPFACQLKPVQFTGTPQPRVEQQQQQKQEFGYATRPQKQAYVTENSQDIDRDFVKKTFAYVPFTNSPVSDTNYDDCDYRGRGVYCCA